MIQYSSRMRPFPFFHYHHTSNSPTYSILDGPGSHEVISASRGSAGVCSIVPADGSSAVRLPVVEYTTFFFLSFSVMTSASEQCVVSSQQTLLTVGNNLLELGVVTLTR